MGIFGFGGYGRKTFDKNTKIFMEKLKKISDGVPDKEKFSIGATLVKILALLDRTEYKPFFALPDLKEIDERISGLLERMQNDADRQLFSSLSSHANLLYEVVKEERVMGRKSPTAGDFNIRMRIAEVFARMDEIVCERRALQSRMENILNSAKALPEGDPKHDLLSREYETCEQRLYSLEKMYEQLDEEYKIQSDLLIAMSEKRFYSSLESTLTSPAELESMLSDFLDDKTASKKNG